MIYKKLLNNDKFHEWFKYEPHDSQYLRYAKSEPSIVAAGFKIGEVYHTFSFARAGLLFSLEGNYGDLASADSEISMLTVKSIFIHNAILQYAICEDLSWQVVWAYIMPSDIKYLMNNEYLKMEKLCNRENLIAQLDCGIAQHVSKALELKSIVKEFDDNSCVKELRELNNFLKHRGNIHIEGLGQQDDQLGLLLSA